VPGGRVLGQRQHPGVAGQRRPIVPEHLQRFGFDVQGADQQGG
jgi:hypothetical protein